MNTLELEIAWGSMCLKVDDIGANNHYFIGWYFFQLFFTCYHYVIVYFGLIEKGLALLIISNHLLCHTL